MKKLIGFVMCYLLALAVAGQDIKGSFAIKNVETGLLLRVKDANKANGTPLVSYTPVEWKCMTWDFKSVGGNGYQLKNQFTGKTFQAVADSATHGMAMHQQPVKEGDTSQQYEFIAVEKGVYLIRLKGTELYLSPSDDRDVNSAIVLSKNNGTKRQRWTLYEQHPTM